MEQAAHSRGAGVTMTIGWPNIESAVWAVIISGIFGFITVRWTAQNNARGAADAAMWSSAPAVMKELNEQTRQLRGEVEILWQRDRECHQQLAIANGRISELERRMDSE